MRRAYVHPGHRPPNGSRKVICQTVSVLGSIAEARHDPESGELLGGEDSGDGVGLHGSHTRLSQPRCIRLLVEKLAQSKITNSRDTCFQHPW